MMRILALTFLLALLARCGSPASPSTGGTTAPRPAQPAQPAPADPTPGSSPPVAPPSPPPVSPGWTVAFREDFQTLAPPAATWRTDERPDDGPYADDGAFFRARGVVPPQAFRATVPFGASNWLTAESYTRSSNAS